MLLEHFQNQFAFVVERRGEPPGSELDIVFGQLVQLFIETGDMFRSIIIGQARNAHLFEHLGALGRRALLAIERHDTPGHQVFASKRIALLLPMRGERAQHEKKMNHQQKQFLKHGETCGG